MSITRNAPPRPSAMLESLRGLGYSTASALADIIDNSISAQATTVEVNFTWLGEASFITILDNGSGMDAAELELAMRLGVRSPLKNRSELDLGRFGFGLKTASFSQARRLTVASRKGGKTSCFRWDLDFLASTNDDGWHLLEGAAPRSLDRILRLETQESGTLVLWEVVDRMISPGFTEQDYLDLIDRVEQHLSMVFHRFIEGPRAQLRITINGRGISAWDPFLSKHPATWSSPVETLATPSALAVVQCHVLPHRDRLDESEYQAAGGPDGWTSQQGFYVYRNQRLLVSGSWLGLGQGRCWTKEEAQRLARIRLDIPNTTDAAWSIDVRKSTARPPVSLKPRLTRLAEDTRERARRVFAHRGHAARVVGDSAVVQAWNSEHFAGGIRYRIDRNHPAVKSVIEDAGPMSIDIQNMLRIIEETVPVQRIWLDTAEGAEVPRTTFSGEPPATVISVLQTLYKNMIERKHLSPSVARDQLLCTDPFHNYPELVSALPDLPERSNE